MTAWVVYALALVGLVVLILLAILVGLAWRASRVLDLRPRVVEDLEVRPIARRRVDRRPTEDECMSVDELVDELVDRPATLEDPADVEDLDDGRKPATVYDQRWLDRRVATLVDESLDDDAHDGKPDSW